MKVLIISLFAIIFTLSVVFASPLYALCGTTEECDRDIRVFTEQLAILGKAKDTLANQIKILDSQVNLTLLKIQQTETSVKLLEEEIASLTVKIIDLDYQLNQLSSQYIYQISQNYKLSKRLPITGLFFASSFNQFLEQYKYLAKIQENSQNTLINMETVRTNFDTQKRAKETKQQELEVLQVRLAEQKNSLAKQKSDKTNLLAVTKNNELKYQQLKKATEDELNSLLKAKFVGKRSVKKGEILGLMGNTGYSFGDHLHFGLYNLREENLDQWSYPNDTDSSDYINSHSWPMNQPIEITQGRGNTKYSYLYSDRFHHGIDMVSPDKTVRAVEEGMAYFYRNSGSSLGNHVKMFHPDGKMSLYLHLQ